MKEIIKSLERQGWTCTRTKKCHWRLRPPAGDRLVFASGTPSDHRSLDNLRATLRQCGAEL